ncbi:hypothetical protein Tco_1089976 [Tanacetum coccineum]|uniref:Reverse transcriptase domain-containing protein n=1 Tax=Tanacetum coccineum TaxID=301880 RepID=A0ABQ5I2W8_9ASTR
MGSQSRGCPVQLSVHVSTLSIQNRTEHTSIRKRISKKRTKNEAENDKTGHLNGKAEKTGSPAPPAVVEPFNLEDPFENPPPPPPPPMDDQRTMAQLLEAPTEGYEDAIVVPEINANLS